MTDPFAGKNLDEIEAEVIKLHAESNARLDAIAGGHVAVLTVERVREALWQAGSSLSGTTDCPNELHEHAAAWAPAVLAAMEALDG